MATETKSPTSTSVIVAGWTNPTYAYSSDNNRTTTRTEFAEQKYSDYGFSIPDNATITKVELGLEFYNSSPNYLAGKIGSGAEIETVADMQGQSAESLVYYTSSVISWTPAKVNAIFSRILSETGGGDACLIENSLILTPEGYKKIDELKIKDEIIGFKDGKKIKAKILAKTMHLQNSEVYEYKGIQMAKTHKIWVDNQWKNVEEVGERKFYKGYFYNIETETENFFAFNGKEEILIHNVIK